MSLELDTIKCKGVHVKLDRLTHAQFKARVAQHGLSMQEAFEHFARLVGADSASANNLLSSLMRNRVKQELAQEGLKPLKVNRRQGFNELDPDKLYDLINEVDEDMSPEPSPGGRNEAA